MTKGGPGQIGDSHKGNKACRFQQFQLDGEATSLPRVDLCTHIHDRVSACLPTHMQHRVSVYLHARTQAHTHTIRDVSMSAPGPPPTHTQTFTPHKTQMHRHQIPLGKRLPTRVHNQHISKPSKVPVPCVSVREVRYSP